MTSVVKLDNQEIFAGVINYRAVEIKYVAGSHPKANTSFIAIGNQWKPSSKSPT